MNDKVDLTFAAKYSETDARLINAISQDAENEFSQFLDKFLKLNNNFYLPLSSLFSRNFKQSKTLNFFLKFKLLERKFNSVNSIKTIIVDNIYQANLVNEFLLNRNIHNVTIQQKKLFSYKEISLFRYMYIFYWILLSCLFKVINRKKILNIDTKKTLLSILFLCHNL